MENNVLENFNVEIKDGEKIAIFGENGSGKTTFVSLLNALYRPQNGKILINDTDIAENIGLLRKYRSNLFQDFPQYEFSVRENIILGDIYRNIPDEESKERIWRCVKYRRYKLGDKSKQTDNFFVNLSHKNKKL